MTQYHNRLFYDHMIQAFGTLPLRDLTPAFLRQWRDTLAQTHAPATVRRYLSVLSAPLTMAVHDYRWLEENPLARVRKPSNSPDRVVCLSEAELQRLLEACEASHQRALYPLVQLALHTGARKNELRFLRWQDVDFLRGVIRFLRTKNKQTRVVPLVGMARAMLQAWTPTRRHPTGYVFPRKKDGRHPVDIQYAWTQAKRQAGLHDFHFHDLRHTAASYLAMSGASLQEIAEVLGHKNLGETMKYTHLLHAHTAAVVARMAAQFLSGTATEEDASSQGASDV